ncbi:hypothetical protein H2200_010001 [Cladophialophora chaetospira]|uniref:Uncharacterized protein n=1 Tax=Cladophialophora chaetospira TaxID=386627 RepID=A0AA39CEL1_9EURO|nr:hypothetical protein H2200_010001 [Cladophialophora chaetospira]
MPHADLKLLARDWNRAQPTNPCNMASDQRIVRIVCPADKDDKCVCEPEAPGKLTRTNPLAALIRLFVREHSRKSIDLVASYICYHLNHSKNRVCISSGYTTMATPFNATQRVRHHRYYLAYTFKPRCLTDEETTKGNFVLSDRYVSFDRIPDMHTDNIVDFDVNDPDLNEADVKDDETKIMNEDEDNEDVNHGGSSRAPARNRSFIVSDPSIDGEDDFVPDSDYESGYDDDAQ